MPTNPSALQHKRCAERLFHTNDTRGLGDFLQDHAYTFQPSRCRLEHGCSINQHGTLRGRSPSADEVSVRPDRWYTYTWALAPWPAARFGNVSPSWTCRHKADRLSVGDQSGSIGTPGHDWAGVVHERHCFGGEEGRA